MKLKPLAKSPWIFHTAGASCGGCGSEILGLASSFFDCERLGVVFVSDILRADILFVTGVVTKKAANRIKRLYEQAQKPCLVVAIGACACGQGAFKGGCNTPSAVDKIIPVDVYVPGCPPRPEAVMQGIITAIKGLG